MFSPHVSSSELIFFGLTTSLNTAQLTRQAINTRVFNADAENLAQCRCEVRGRYLSGALPDAHIRVSTGIAPADDQNWRAVAEVLAMAAAA